jgi:predicted ribosomally synthesized peptide with SipW-like signal peptide
MHEPEMRANAIDGTVSGTDGSGPTSAPNGHPPAAATPALPAAGRYHQLEEIAHGGMGVIYRATDTVLDREVAVKVLQEQFAPNSPVARRFLEEARITGQLQYPGVPAVYDLGALPDGRPFLAMKLVRGHTLDALLRDRADPSQDRGRFLAVFEQICQAVGYAHAHDVIHRDLKPANVMVGAFGEVQVMDWGLAKLLTAGPAAATEAADPAATLAATAIRSARELEDETRAGSVLGTLAFMPPEQAIGAVDQIDQRSDVFGLGAVLCAILTGQPPYRGADSESTRQLAARAKLDDAFARLDDCGAEPELVALCKRCLAPEKTDRPGDAGEVARAVAALRAAADERARRAELDRVRAETEAREQRRRRRAQLALAVAVGLLLAAGGVFAWWQDRQEAQRHAEERDRAARNADALSALLTACTDALRAGDAERAATALEEAERRLPERGGDDVRERIDACRADLVALRDLDALDQFRWTLSEGKFPEPAAVATRIRAAFERFGAVPVPTAPDETARRVAASAVRERLVGALDLWLLVEQSGGARAVAQVVDDNGYRNAVRDAVLAKDWTRVAKLAGQKEALAQPAEFAAFLGGIRDVGLGRVEQGVAPVERRRELLAAALVRRPGDLGLLMTLGYTYPIDRREGAEERLRWFQAAVAAHPDNPAAHNSLGLALFDKGDWEGAVAEYTEAGRLDSQNAMPHNNLGIVLRHKGDLDGAIASFQKASRLDPNSAKPHYNRGNALFDKEDLDGAVVAFHEAIRLNPNYASAHNNLGWVLQTKGELDGAVAAYKEALRCDPKNPKTGDNLARVERWRELRPRLSEVAAGRADPATPAEGCEFAHLCAQPFQKRYVLAVRLYQRAFAADPKLAGGVKASYRYDAACAAALAGAGKDAELVAFGVEEWGYLTDLAQRWLQAELVARTAEAREPKNAERVRQQMTHWKRDADLSAVRDAAWLVAMPESDRQRWQKFWAEVDALLARVSRPATPPADPKAS